MASEDGPGLPPIFDVDKVKPRDELGNNLGSHDQGEYSRATYMTGLLMPDIVQHMRVITDIVIIVLSWCTVALETFVRRDFGERYYSWVRLWMSYNLLGLWVMLTSVGGLLGAKTFSPAFAWFTFLFTVLACVHRFHIWRQSKKGVVRHTMSFGVSWLEGVGRNWLEGRLRISNWTLYNWVEPLFWLTVGLGIWQFEKQLGGFIQFAAMGMLVKNQMVYAERRGRMLDRNDAIIEQYMVTMDLEANGQEHEQLGYELVTIPPAMYKNLARLRRGAQVKPQVTANVNVPSPTAANDNLQRWQATVNKTMGNQP